MGGLGARLGIYFVLLGVFLALTFAGVVPVGSPLWMIVLVGLIVASFPLLRGGVSTGKVLQTGVPAVATLTGIQETGVSMGTDLVPRLSFEVQLPGQAPYAATTTVRVPRLMTGSLQLGKRYAVKVDPSNPQKVAIDWQASASMG